MVGPLHGIRLLDLSERSPAAAIAGMALADFGAEVIRVEPEGGDSLRALDAVQVWYRGQQSVTIGPEQVRDGSWQRLRASADVVLDTAHPWTAKPGGLLDGWGDDPRQILCVLTALPQAADLARLLPPQGDAAVYGELLEAQYGFMHMQQGFREGPIFMGMPHAVTGAAELLEIGILGALLEQRRTGRGQVVTTSLLDGMAAFMTSRWVRGEHFAPRPERFGLGRSGNRRNVTALFECGDGRWIQTHTGGRGAFDRMMKVLGRDDVVWDESSGQPAPGDLEPAVADELWEFVPRIFKTKPAQYWADVLSAADVSCLPALPSGEGMWLEQAEANGIVESTPDGRRQVGVAAKFSRTPAQPGRGVPAPGQHNDLLRQHHAPSARPVRQNGSVGSTKSAGPLEGIVVLDLSQVLSGPFSARLLSDLGARVIKIEEVASASPLNTMLDISSRLGTERGKENLPLNLKTGDGRQIFYELVRKADVVLLNMRLRAAVGLGIDYPTLAKINPRLVYCHSAGYGMAGPWASWPAWGVMHCTITGLMDRASGRGNPPLHMVASADYVSGMANAVAMLAGLVEREHSGEGQHVEAVQLGAAFQAMSDVFFEGDRKVESFELDPAQRGHAVTNALYPTKDGWIVLACYSDQEWQRVPGALGILSTGWPSYQTARHEVVSESASGAAIEQVLTGLTAAEAEQRLRAEQIACAVPMRSSSEEILDEPRFRDIGMVVVEQHPEGGRVSEIGHMVRHQQATGIRTQPAPTPGQHTPELLTELGRPAAEIERLIAAKVVRA